LSTHTHWSTTTEYRLDSNKLRKGNTIHATSTTGDKDTLSVVIFANLLVAVSRPRTKII
jgi:hypothetical protein